MRSEKEVRDKLSELKDHDLLKLPTATVDENAPVALSQIAIEEQIRILKWVLEEKRK